MLCLLLDVLKNLNLISFLTFELSFFKTEVLELYFYWRTISLHLTIFYFFYHPFRAFFLLALFIIFQETFGSSFPPILSSFFTTLPLIFSPPLRSSSTLASKILTF